MNQKKKPIAASKLHERIPSKVRDEVALLYRCRMITVAEACAKIGIRRTAFYAMLQNHYGFKEGKFKALSDEGFQSGMEYIIHSIVDEQGDATCALIDYLSQAFPQQADTAEDQKKEIPIRLTNNDILLLNREAREKLLEEVYEMGYRAGVEASTKPFDAGRWLKATAATSEGENKALETLISIAEKKSS